MDPLHMSLIKAFLIFVPQVTMQESCRDLRFKEIAKNKALANHTFRTIRPISSFDRCVENCYTDLRCYAVNLCTKSDGSLVCNLLSSDYTRNKYDLLDKPGCTHYSTTTACSSSPCLNNASCQGDFSKGPVHRCICLAGYTGQMCQLDIQECLDNKHDCHVNATCTNTKGSYTCNCKEGFRGNGKICHDVDECATIEHVCHVNGVCTNTQGSYDCKCKYGYQGDGKSCTDIDECVTNAHGCDGNAVCTNTGGSYSCECKSGYQGNGKNCQDIDECATIEHVCHVNANCTNTQGSYVCLCKSGYEGDGKSCTALSPCEALKATLTDDQLQENRVFPLQNVAHKYSVFCSFSGFQCGVGMWHLAMKINGNKTQSFAFEMPIWKDRLPHGKENAKSGLEDKETKTSAFWETRLKKLCLGMKPSSGKTNWIAIDVEANSLREVFRYADKELETNITESKWKNLMPGSGLHQTCSKQGFNLDGGKKNNENRKLRIGIIGSNVQDCKKYYSFIGAGASSGLPSCGSYAKRIPGSSSPNVKRAFCYFLVSADP